MARLNHLSLSGALGAAAVVIVSAAAGCGRTLPEVVPVCGVATVAGKPVVMMDVVFQPLPGTAGSGAVGRTGTDGRFEMLAIVGGTTRVLKGARPGRYRVVLAEPELYDPNGLPLRRPAEAGPVNVPSIYMDATKSPLEVDVARGMADVVLDLKAK
jgi:hypothetical protein